jgi:5-methylcytosine-specific restriction endonuclease McrA
MNKEIYSAYLRTPEWKATRFMILEIRSHKCELCESTYRLEVHHKTYKNLGCEPPEDLQLLCRSCHSSLHNRKSKTKKRKSIPRGKISKVYKNLYAR